MRSLSRFQGSIGNMWHHRHFERTYVPYRHPYGYQDTWILTFLGRGRPWFPDWRELQQGVRILFQRAKGFPFKGTANPKYGGGGPTFTREGVLLCFDTTLCPCPLLGLNYLERGECLGPFSLIIHMRELSFSNALALSVGGVKTPSAPHTTRYLYSWAYEKL